MKFKGPHMEDQLQMSCQALQDLSRAFEELSLALGVVPIVTRVWDAVQGDSGVHEAKRAIDFRNETRDYTGKSIFLYSPEQVADIVKRLNDSYPRRDGHVVAIHHSFQGMPYHFHLQCSLSQAVNGLLVERRQVAVASSLGDAESSDPEEDPASFV